MIDYKKIYDEYQTELANAKARMNVVSDAIKSLSQELNIPLDINLPNEVEKQIKEVGEHIANTQTELDGLIKELEVAQ